MASFAKDKKTYKLIYSRVAVFVVFIVIILMGFSVFSVFGKRQDAREQAEMAEREYQELLDRKAHTEAELQRLETDQGVEEAIRDKYRAVKEGEELIVIVNKENIKQNEEIQKGFFSRIGDFFK